MSIYLPTYVDSRYCKRNRLEGTWYQVHLPLSGKYTDLPSAFEEKPYGRGNDVCHVKTKTATLQLGDTPILFGPTWYSRRSSYFKSLQDAVYMPHHAVWMSFSYLTDTPGQMIGGCRYDIEIVHYRETSRMSAKTKFYQRKYGSHKFEVFVYPDGSVKHILNRDSDRGSYRGCARGMGDWLALSYDLPRYVFNDAPPESTLVKIAEDVLDRYVSLYYPLDADSVSDTLGSEASNVSVMVTHQLPDSSSLWNKLILDEYNLVFEGYSAKPFASYHLKRMQQGAYLDCLDHVPQMNENNISNILGIVALIKSIVIDRRVEIPKSLSSAWLSYRYAYSTTKSDLEEAIDFQHRMVDSTFLDRGFDCYGSFSDTISDVNVTCRCHIKMKQKELDWLSKISTALYRYGLSPSFYVFWDMVPYSFIVDWFIPIGDILSGYDKTRMYDRTYDMEDIWFSFKYEWTEQDGSYSAYTRFGSSALPEFQGYYTLDNKGTPSDKTIGFRILDAASLLFR